MKNNERKLTTVTLKHMQTRLQEACCFRFKMMRSDNRQWLRAMREGRHDDEAYWRGIVIQSRCTACELYDLYLESQGLGWHVHSFNTNERDVRRVEKEGRA